jgi:hypothetical protein
VMMQPALEALPGGFYGISQHMQLSRANGPKISSLL